MRKTTLLFIFLSLLALETQAQAVSGYLFSESTETYLPVAGTNSTADGDDGTENNIPIGFTFNFGGVEYTTFSISVNGFIRLGNNVGNDNYINVLANNAIQRPLIAAFWDDHNRHTGSIEYLATGNSPTRILEVGWNNINIDTGGGTSDTEFGSFKMRLHENGTIDFIYGPTMDFPDDITASIGINDMISFMSVTPASGAASPSNTTPNNGIADTAFLVGKKYTFTPSPQCLGMPNPGNTLATETAVCPDIAFTLSLENTPNVFGLSYQWQSSPTPDDLDYVDIPDSNTSNLTLTQGNTTYYRCVVTCSGLDAVSTPVMVTSNPLATCFCYPNYDFGKTDGDLISNVVIAGTALANNSGVEAVNPFYTFFTGQPNYTATLQPGVSYDVSVTVGAYQEQNVAVWIDYNDDTIFSDSERVGYTTEMIDSNGTGTFPIVLACDPPAGVHRMRIRDVWNTEGITISPCATYGYGETEDYDITIVAGDACPAPYALNTGVVNSTNAQLVWNVGCGQLSWDIHVGLDGSGLPSGEPSNPGVGTNPFVKTGLLPSTDYEFYVRANCADDATSIWAGPFAFTTAAPAVPNDECESAYVLIPGGNFDEHAMIATNEGASKSIGYPNPTCAAFAFGGDVWFSVVVPADGNITIETRSAAGSPVVDTGLNVFSGTCGALTVMGCNDEGGEGGFSLLSYTGLVPGSTIYARVWEYANDTIGAFRVSAWNASLGTGSFDSNHFDYYPNPVKSTLNLSYSQNISDVKVYNLVGQQVLGKTLNANLSEVDMSALPAGTYIVKVTAEGQVKTIKVIKE